MLGELINKAQELEYVANRREGVGISSMGYCGLQTHRLYFRKEQKQIDPGNLLAMRTGTATHASLFSLLWKFRGDLEGFIYKRKEVEVNIQTPAGNTLKGHADLLAEFDGELWVVDLKVVDEKPFSYISESPREHDEAQVMLYAYGLNLKRYMVLYLCKSGKTKGQFKECPGAVDEVKVQKLLKKYDQIIAGTIQRPFAEPTDSWECNYCDYYEECWGKKTFLEKQDGVAEIPADLETDYVAAKVKADEYGDKADEIKVKIVTSLAGKRGEGDLITAAFVPGKISERVDLPLLKRLVDPTTLAKAVTKKQGDGYYTLRIKGEK